MEEEYVWKEEEVVVVEQQQREKKRGHLKGEAGYPP